MSAEASAPASGATTQANHLTVYGPESCPHTTAQVKALDDAGLPFVFIPDKMDRLTHASSHIISGYPTLVCQSSNNRDGVLHSGELSADEVRAWCKNMK